METRVDISRLENIYSNCLEQFFYQSDEKTFHKTDYWVGPEDIKKSIEFCGRLIGDCDDFASLCVMRCREAKLPARFVYCFTETKEPHLVCEVNGWILDNRFPRVINRDDLKYEWVAISGYNAGDLWSLVEQ